MEKRNCPKCKSNNVISIIYGYPAPDAMEESESIQETSVEAR